jgi:hypothetical protein
MKWRHLKYPATIAAAVAAVGCGSQSSQNATLAPTGTAPLLVSVPGISSAVTYSFDLGQIDTGTGRYYVTDRTNKAIDVMNTGGSVANVLNSPVTLFKQAYAGCNSGGTTGGQTNIIVAMPGCLNIAITANFTYVINNDLSGPDGLDIVGPNLFAGDVNALWVINKTTGALVTKIAIPNSGVAQVPQGPVTQGFRSDEGCYDPLNHLYATALTADPNNPFYTILDTTAHDADATGATAPVVMGQLLMNDSAGAPAAGLEACFFDTRGNTTPNLTTVAAGFMWMNNDGTTTNPRGEADGIPIGDLVAWRNAGGFPKKVVFAGPLTATPNFGAAGTSAPVCALGGGGACGTVAVKTLGMPANCDSTGIAAGPAAGNEAGAMCRSGTFGQSLDFVIFNTGGNTVTAPTIVTTVVGAGGGDQVAFDSAGGAAGRYYLANSRQTANKKSCFNGGVQVCNLTPKLTVVDATTHAVVANVDSGNNAHSVAVGLGMVFMPFSNTSATAGGANFPNGGVAIYPTM